ncbi:MAG TPA: NHL repeat-containing protein [bacterium]|nr:NHL repeat-containing protein [bacterium]
MPPKAKKNKRARPAGSGSTRRLKVALIATGGLGLALLLGVELVRVLNAPRPDVFLPATLMGKFSGFNQPCGKFNAWDVAALGNDGYVVTDAENGRVLFFDKQGKFLKSWGKKGNGPEDLKEPSSVITDEAGNTYFIDAWASALMGLDKERKPILDVPVTQGFYGPRGLAWDGKNFFVADTGAHRVVELTKEGNFVTYWGGKMGDGKDQLNDPYAIAAYGGYLYVADANNHRIQVLDPSVKNQFVRNFSVGKQPTDLVFDKQGRLFVSFFDDGIVGVFNSNGKSLGKLKDDLGSVDPFRNINGLGIAPDGLLLLASADKILMYRVP